jgi:hypothetical protein
VDEFNLAYAITPGSFVDFIEGVVPVLQQRRLMQAGYEEGMLRDKLFRKGHARLRELHPAAHPRQRWGAPVNVPLEDSRHADGSHSFPVAKSPLGVPCHLFQTRKYWRLPWRADFS